MSLRVRYETHEFDQVDIHLRSLRSNQEFEDDAGEAEALGISSATWPLFGIVWPSGKVLAHHLYHSDFKDKRILEVGCGIGLTSILLNHLHADITATDYHPRAESFMQCNTDLNNDPRVPFVRTGWADPETDLGKFDLIIGSDLLYEDEHVKQLAGFICQHSKPEGEVVLVDPGRGRHARFSKAMEEAGFTLSIDRPGQPDFMDNPFKGVILSYSR
ncbi:methyltransferase domain-containing protein [Amphritea sp. 2_MG-2023]|jgi:predicted nicotinamide N-methyase|uniref:class I SAM-dependent methyltransferase n=1 Tax=Amphritea TaxID=515417 RepID=UPI001C06812B|nr:MULTISPECIES: methyltransferase domain-containing protein [Amphritea]MBU2965497.1 methyltransferase domain-containing protein [Amphritea atlantica]MDO6418653.1 methyltransferase domain-containing protein [Amphritea sp. 2_MG-2023]